MQKRTKSQEIISRLRSIRSASEPPMRPARAKGKISKTYVKPSDRADFVKWKTNNGIAIKRSPSPT